MNHPVFPKILILEGIMLLILFCNGSYGIFESTAWFEISGQLVCKKYPDAQHNEVIEFWENDSSEDTSELKKLETDDILETIHANATGHFHFKGKASDGWPSATEVEPYFFVSIYCHTV